MDEATRSIDTRTESLIECDSYNDSFAQHGKYYQLYIGAFELE